MLKGYRDKGAGRFMIKCIDLAVRRQVEVHIIHAGKDIHLSLLGELLMTQFQSIIIMMYAVAWERVDLVYRGFLHARHVLYPMCYHRLGIRE